VALNGFEGTVQVRGEVIGYKQEVAIVQVEAVL
jgi:hypothetical protein